jgi:hypothetical protein
MRNIKKNTTCAVLVAAITLTAHVVFAATADNVRCSQCVDTSDIKKAAVTTARVKDGAITLDKLSPSVVTLISQQSSASRPQFVGFSTDTFDGSQGVITYTRACQLDYPGSRMCTTEEFLSTTDYPIVDSSAFGWIRPVVTAAYVSTTSNIVDVSGFSADVLASSCNGWRATSAHGLYVDGKGRLSNETCEAIMPVSCCGTR